MGKPAEKVTSFSSSLVSSFRLPTLSSFCIICLAAFLHLPHFTIQSSNFLWLCMTCARSHKLSFGLPQLTALPALLGFPHSCGMPRSTPRLLTWDFCHFHLNDPYILRLQWQPGQLGLQLLSNATTWYCVLWPYTLAAAILVPIAFVKTFCSIFR